MGQEVVSLDDVYLNNLDIPNQIVIPDYVHTVRRLNCGDHTSRSTNDDGTVHFDENQSGLNMAMEGILIHFTDFYEPNRHKKIVIVTNCDDITFNDDKICDF